MKLSVIFTTLTSIALAEKGRPPIIDAMKRLEKLKGNAESCAQDSFFDGKTIAGNERKRINRKLEFFNRVATNFCQNADEAAAEMAAEEEGLERINFDDPCSCLGGIAGGYKSFFNRVQDKYPGLEIKGFKRNRVIRSAKNFVTNVLNGKYGCTLPN